jgi:hypothetical protein
MDAPIAEFAEVEVKSAGWALLSVLFEAAPGVS